MRINKITIRNFRGFEQQSFDFDKRLTVIVGNNTAGKTTILKAIQIALGAYLNSLTALRGDTSAHQNFSPQDIYTRYSEEKRDFFRNPASTRIDVDADFPVMTFDGNAWSPLSYKSISWWREIQGQKTSHAKKCTEQLLPLVNEMERMRQSDGQNAVYPLVLSFGANRINNQYSAAQKTKSRESKIVKAYKSALKETVDFRSAFDWLYRSHNNLHQGTAFKGNKEAFLLALTTAIPALSDIRIDEKNHEFIARVSVTGYAAEVQTFDHMSDGLKAMICMVAEIAHRCIELNDFLGLQAVTQTPGIVLIDELDLYLHPRWQRHVLKDLCNAFPNIQFIATSHSPFIIQSVKTANVITLDGHHADTDPDKRSIEEIAIQEMNMENELRSKRYMEMIDAAERYYRLIKEGSDTHLMPDDILRHLEEIEAEFSDDPAYVAFLRAERSTR